MDQELNHRLEQLEKTVEENNTFLRKMYRAMVWGRIYRIIYWVLIIGLAIGAFYFLQPYIDQVLKVYTGLNSTAQKLIQFGR